MRCAAFFGASILEIDLTVHHPDQFERVGDTDRAPELCYRSTARAWYVIWRERARFVSIEARALQGAAPSL